MRWSERQLAMLREMGIRVWAPETPTATEEAGAATLVAERTPEPAALPGAAPVARAPATVYERGADRPVPASREAASAAAPSAPRSLVSAEWLVVGEPFASTAADPAAAAEQELLLDNMLRAIRISRGSEGREGRACHLPVDEGQAAGIAAAIEAVRPRCILALGRAAAVALLGIDEPLGKLRERLHQRDGIPVVVTFALPYLLRHAADKPRAWADLCRAVAAIA
jgi:DNA polymerase